MRLTVLTYDHPHRKTEDVVARLLLNGYPAANISLVLLPWVDRKPRNFLYAHRPGEMGWPCGESRHPMEWGMEMGLTVLPPDDTLAALAVTQPHVVVVGGAGILPAEIVNGYTVLNVHPGLLPTYRGLDALKWTIMEGGEVGVTAHICDERADLGRRLLDEKVPVYKNDTFHAFAMRQYEAELRLLIPALRLLSEHSKEEFPLVEPGDTISRRRMPNDVEVGLLDAFDRYRVAHA